MNDKYIFIDRDGVVNIDGEYITDSGYILNPENFRFVSGVLKAFKLANDRGFKCVIISNQQCVGKGLCTREELDKVTEYMKDNVAANGGNIDAVYYCIHKKEDGCACRKPGTGLFEMAALDLGLELSRDLYYIGDTERDIAAGNAAGLKTILVLSGKTVSGDGLAWEVKPDLIFGDLFEAVEFITGGAR